MSFLSDIGGTFANIGHFLGIGNQDDDQKKRQQQQQAQAQRPAPQFQGPQIVDPGQLVKTDVQQPQPDPSDNGLVQSGKAPSKITPQPPVQPGFHSAVPLVKTVGQNVPQAPPSNDKPFNIVDFGKGLVSGIQQGIGGIGDIALQGGALLGTAADNINPFINDKQRQANINQQIANTELLRKTLHGVKDVSGENIVGTSDVDQNAANIAAGRGNAQDYLAVAGKGLQTGVDATSFINPAELLTKTAGATGVKTIAKQAARDAAFYGGTQGTATGAQVYGQTGDVGQALVAGAESGLTSGLTQGGVELGAGLAGKGIRRVIGGDTPDPAEIAPGLKSTNPAQATDAAAAADKQAEAAAQQRQARPLVDPNAPVQNAAGPVPTHTPEDDPAFFRKQEADAARQQFLEQEQAKLDQATLAEPHASAEDVPAFQRQGKVLPSIQAKQARVDDLNKLVDNSPTPSGAKAIEFRIKQKFADDLRDKPHLKPQLTKLMNNALDNLKAQVSAANAARDERDALLEEVNPANREAAQGKAIQEGIDNPVATPEPAQAVPEPAQAAPVAERPVETVQPTPAVAEAAPAVETAPVVTNTGGELQVPPTDGKVAISPENVPTTEKQVVPAQTERTAKTGETGKSQGKNAKGREIELSSVEAANTRGANQAANTSFKDFMDNVQSKSLPTPADRDTAKALQERFPRGSEEFKALSHVVGDVHTEAAQTLATAEREARATANSKQLTDRFANKIYANIGDNAKITDEAFSRVEAKNQAFTDARDAQHSALDKFNQDPSEANTQAFAKSFKASEDADRAARFEEYKVASQASKGVKEEKSKLFVDKLKKDAGVYTMDATDTSLLSSSRVMLNNYYNTVGSLIEELGIFSKLGTKLGRALTGTKIGGGSFAGARLGSKIGRDSLATDARLRQGADGNILVKSAKNFTTTGNTLGEHNVYATAYAGVYDHYREKLKAEGYKGDELKRRSLVNSLADPDKVLHGDDKHPGYMNQALASNAMSSLTNGKTSAKLESFAADKIAQRLGGGAAGKFVGKATTRLLLGFPTVVARSAIEGGKRATLGIPTALHAAYNAVSGGDREVTAQLIKSSVKELGSGATMLGVGAGLGAAGIISGSYPKDKDMQAQWEREGKTENSINIGGNWYNLPAALGVFALPFMLGANAGSNVNDGKGALDNVGQSTVDTLIDSIPVDSVGNAIKFINDAQAGRDTSKYLATLAASATKIATPLGSLVGEVAKMFDPNVNDTTKGDFMQQFLAKVQSGNPFTIGNVEDKVVEGNKLDNPNPIATFLGAVTHEQGKGEAQTVAIQKAQSDAVKSMTDNGVFGDNVRNILPDDATKQIFDQIKSGKDTDPSDMKTLVSALTKNVSSDSDTRFLEDGDYDGNLAVLKTKRDSLAADPTTREADLKKYDDEIKRGEIYKKDQIPYDLNSKYKSTSLSEWRDLGDPESDTYNPDLYQKLFAIDEALAGAGVSRNPNDETQDKFSAKKLGKGRGGRGGSKSDGNTLGSLVQLNKTSFGDLKLEKTNSTVKIPTLQQVQPGELIKKRAISVSKA